MGCKEVARSFDDLVHSADKRKVDTLSDSADRSTVATGDTLETFWIMHPLVLRGTNIELRPLEFETLDALFAVAQDP